MICLFRRCSPESIRGAEKIREIYDCFGTRKMSEDKCAFEFGVRSKGGMVEFELTPEQ